MHDNSASKRHALLTDGQDSVLSRGSGNILFTTIFRKGGHSSSVSIVTRLWVGWPASDS